MPQMKLVFNDQEMVRRRDDRLRHMADPEQEMRRLVSSSWPRRLGLRCSSLKRACKQPTLFRGFHLDLLTGEGVCHVEFQGAPEDAQNWFVGSADVKNAFHQMRSWMVASVIF